ncbi:AAA family ATPase [Actinomadura violacea]|uniref:ATP-binding protein n=1 Tax=Actinomadura violacea TaxID=2819934 RepID=A0ABS3RWS8_9ACTN|nr:AAA family ATPase [Actinomadura violacea]MBO2461210.1 ATP-binding protein [Actinomadura violacea]
MNDSSAGPTGPAGGDSAGSAASFLPPAVLLDRECADGWRRWRLTRHDAPPAPRWSPAQYQAASPRTRGLYDLHRCATHANLAVQETPMSAAVARVVASRIRTNALKRKPSTRAGVMVNGGGYQGKTETVCEVAALFEEWWLELHHQLNPDALPGTRDLHAPVAYVQTPVTATPKSTCEAILDFYGEPHKNMTLPQLVRTVKAALHAHGTKALILDDITRLKMHREADQDVLDLIRSLMSMSVTLVLVGVGIPQSGLLRDSRYDARSGQWVFPPATGRFRSRNDAAGTQTERRFDLIELGPFRYDTAAQIDAWVHHLAGIQDQLRLLKAEPAMLTSAGMPEYLFRRTDGIVGLLERLIEDGCSQAIDSGAERLTTGLLDSVTISLDHLPVRDPAAGEVPAIPAPPSRVPRRKRPRNTSFDDGGTPAATRR